MASRATGLVRQRVFAHFFGSSDAADVFWGAFKIPNFLQNMFGEGVLSASFIPVYVKLRAQGQDVEARRVASAVATLLAIVQAVLVLVGVLAAPLLTTLIVPGFTGSKRDLAIQLVRILFPGTGLLVLSAWCLGVLNSHRRFLLPYLAPVAWNLTMIATLIVAGMSRHGAALAVALAWGAVGGSVLQLLVQLPTAVALVGSLRPMLGIGSEHVRTVFTKFVPVFIGRGVVQVSAIVDEVLASLLGTGAVAGLGYAQTLYVLPVSLFGMAVSAAELPYMAGTLGAKDEVDAALRQRIERGLRRIAFFVLPSLVAFLALGDVIAAGLYQTGAFDRGDVVYVWAILAGYSLGLLASTFGRLFASAFYAVQDTRTPLVFAIVRVTIGIVLGYAAALHLPGVLGVDPKWGAAPLAAASGVSAWVELILLRRALAARIGTITLPPALLAKLGAAAACGAAAAWAIKLLVGTGRPFALAGIALPLYGTIYLALCTWMGIPEARSFGPMRRT